MVRTKEELQKIAEDAFGAMPKDLKPSETNEVISMMLHGTAVTLKNHGN